MSRGGQSTTAENLRTIGAATLSDALGKTGAMDHGIRPRSARASMAGPAFPVRMHPADILMVAPALAACPAGHVLVLATTSHAGTAIWGEITTEAAARRKLAGVVTDGAIRDSAAIAKSRLPVFARSIVPNAGGAEFPGEIGVTVSCGGATIAPGDWVVGDEDGVVVIPQERLQATIERALAIVEAEKEIVRKLRAGGELASILGVDRKLASKSIESAIPQLGARRE